MINPRSAPTCDYYSGLRELTSHHQNQKHATNMHYALNLWVPFWFLLTMTKGFRSIVQMRRISFVTTRVWFERGGPISRTRTFVSKGGGWDDYEDEEDYATSTRKKREKGGDNNKRRNTHSNGRNRYDSSSSRTNFQRGNRQQHYEVMDRNRINMRLLEQEAGFDHLYGISPVLNALKAKRRDFQTAYVAINEENDDIEEPVKAEAQTRPYLFVQQESSSSSRTVDKAEAVSKALALAEELFLSIAYVDKGVLNTLSNNRPHQGLVLRCGKLAFEPFESFREHNFWLVLDQVVDPQNFGALVRTAEFLQVPAILVCGKHSAPASAVVSAASAGALENPTVKIYSTNSLPRTLASAASASTIIGAAANVRPDFDAPLYQLDEFPTDLLSEPILLVLGSEGHGLRFSVAKSCTHFCRIPGDGSVDSLNVSVSGGIFLWHFLRSVRTNQTD